MNKVMIQMLKDCLNVFAVVCIGTLYYGCCCVGARWLASKELMFSHPDIYLINGAILSVTLIVGGAASWASITLVEINAKKWYESAVRRAEIAEQDLRSSFRSRNGYLDLESFMKDLALSDATIVSIPNFMITNLAGEEQICTCTTRRFASAEAIKAILGTVRIAVFSAYVYSVPFQPDSIIFRYAELKKDEMVGTGLLAAKVMREHLRKTS